MLAAAIATPVVFSACALLIFFLRPRYKRWLERRVSSRTQRDIEGKRASIDPDEDDPITPALDSSTPLNPADAVMAICPNSAATNTTPAMSPTSSKSPGTPIDCISTCLQEHQHQCAQACTSPPLPPLPPPDALPSPPPSPSSRAPSRSSRNSRHSRLRANVAGLVNRIGNAARSPSVGSSKSSARRGAGGRRRSRADPVLPRATPTFHFNADDMFAPRGRPPLPQRPQASSVIIQRGRATSPVVPPQSPPPQSLLPPPPDLASDPAPALAPAQAQALLPAMAPLPIPASRSSRGCSNSEKGKRSRVRPLPPLPKLSWPLSHGQSPSQSSLVSSQPMSSPPPSLVASPISSLRSLPHPAHQMSLTSAMSPPLRPYPLPPVPALEPLSVPMSMSMSMLPGMMDFITAFQPAGGLHQHQQYQPGETSVAAALAPLAPHDQRPLPAVSSDDCSESSLPPPYTSHSPPS